MPIPNHPTPPQKLNGWPLRLVIWHVFTTGEVEGDIKEVYNLFVGFDRFFKAMLAEDVAKVFLDLLCLSRRWLGYSKAVVSVQAKVVAMFLFDGVQEVGPTSSHDSAPS